MLLATRKNGTRDGQLILIREDRAAWTDASGIAPHLQAALDDWAEVAPRLAQLQMALNHGHVPATDLDASELLSPLPRAYEWIDGSAYLNHVRLVRKARNAEPARAIWIRTQEL